MRLRLALLACFCASLAQAVMIDRIAIVMGTSIIKDSDIERDLRVTEFLNNAKLDLGEAARKQAAQRLIDQNFIRKEVQAGDYPRASFEDADKRLAQLKKQRFHTEAAFQTALAHYGISNEDLRFAFRWQLTVLNFVDLRFKPAAYVTDEEIKKYYDEHAAQLTRQHPGKSSFDQLRTQISDTLSGDKVNTLFFAWLDEQRKSGTVNYHEEALR